MGVSGILSSSALNVYIFLQTNQSNSLCAYVHLCIYDYVLYLHHAEDTKRQIGYYALQWPSVWPVLPTRAYTDYITCSPLRSLFYFFIEIKPNYFVSAYQRPHSSSKKSEKKHCRTTDTTIITEKCLLCTAAAAQSSRNQVWNVRTMEYT